MSALKKKPSGIEVPNQFRSSIHTSDEERRLLFRSFLDRFEKRHELTRPEAVTAVAIRLGRTPHMIYHWLSKAERNRAIPFAMLDLLIYEEIMHETGVFFGQDPILMYQNADRLTPSMSVKGIES